MKKRELIISILLHALLLLIIYVFQGVIFPFMRLNGLAPLLLPIASTGIALYEGRDSGGVSGLFAGILCDISFNRPVGTFTVLLTLMGLFIGALADAYILRGFVTYYFCCAAVLIICAIVQMFPLILHPLLDIPAQFLISTAIQQTLYSLIMAFPIWFFVRALGKRTDRMPSSRRTV